MAGKLHIPKKITALLVYGRPPLVFGGMICAIAVMWTRNPLFYTLGVTLLFVSMTFDLVDGWFAARFSPHEALAQLAERIMDKVVYAIIFPLVAVGIMWRLIFVTPSHSKAEMLHAIFVLLLCVTVLIRDSFAHFMRSFATRGGQEPELSELTRLRTMVAAPVGALLYAHAFYIPEGPPSAVYFWISWLGNLPVQGLMVIEIVFLVINFGSIAGFCRKYGSLCLDELCLGDDRLRRRILSFFPNALTVMNAMMGLMAVFFAYQDRVREAYLLLIGAALFDKLDGAVARRLGLTEPLPGDEHPPGINIGSILDDISDAISFCIVPAWIFYICMSAGTDPVLQRLPVGLAAIFYTVMGIIRLIYFTLDKHPIPGFFKGLPTPAAAMLVVAPLILFSQAAQVSAHVRSWGLFCFALMVVAGILMNVYYLRYLHLGRFMSRKPWFARISALLLIFALTPYTGHVALAYMILYVLSPLITKGIDPQEAARENRDAPNG
jgi:CDP-diacylglycerol--serine O-phosphatidyltransferase